jgi:hypothetical protein
MSKKNFRTLRRQAGLPPEKISDGPCNDPMKEMAQIIIAMRKEKRKQPNIIELSDYRDKL